VLPNQFFWEAKRNQVSDFSAASSHNASQPPKADIDEYGRDVRFVPKADI
jgi:hypothetical protein